MSRRIQLKLSCPMNLRQFPFDSQKCSIKIASYGHTSEQIVYLWKKSSPVQVTSSLSLPEYSLTDYNTDYCTARTVTGEYSCLAAHFTLEREWSRYIYQVYVDCDPGRCLGTFPEPLVWNSVILVYLQIFMPVLMLVVIAYLTAWIQDAAARAVLLSVVFAVTLLGYCSLSFVLPRTAYAKAVDNFLIIR